MFNFDKIGGFFGDAADTVKNVTDTVSERADQLGETVEDVESIFDPENPRGIPEPRPPVLRPDPQPPRQDTPDQRAAPRQGGQGLLAQVGGGGMVLALLAGIYIVTEA